MEQESKTTETGRKQFAIPNQIDGRFHIWRFLTLREFLILAPFVALGYYLFRYVFVDMALNLKAFLSFLPLVLCMAMIFIRPVQERRNINLFQMMIWRIQYNQRQRCYYFKRKY
jgi:hypothetical protein